MKNKEFFYYERRQSFFQHNLCNGLIKIAALNFANLLFFFQIVAIFLSNWKCINYLPSFYFECYWQLLPIYRKIYESMVIYDIMGHQISLLRGVIWNKFHAESITWLWLIWWLIIFSRYFGTKKGSLRWIFFKSLLIVPISIRLSERVLNASPIVKKVHLQLIIAKGLSSFLEMYSIL